jgi:hypothetical protein
MHYLRPLWWKFCTYVEDYDANIFLNLSVIKYVAMSLEIKPLAE